MFSKTNLLPFLSLFLFWELRIASVAPKPKETHEYRHDGKKMNEELMQSLWKRYRARQCLPARNETSRQRQPSFEGVFLLFQPLCPSHPPFFSPWFAFKLSNIPTTSGSFVGVSEVKDFAFSGAHFIPTWSHPSVSLLYLFKPFASL